MLHHELKESINKSDNNPLFCREKYSKTKKNMYSNGFRTGQQNHEILFICIVVHKNSGFKLTFYILAKKAYIPVKSTSASSKTCYCENLQ